MCPRHDSPDPVSIARYAWTCVLLFVVVPFNAVAAPSAVAVLTVAANPPVLLVGQVSQLEVTTTYPTGSTRDLTAAATGTRYSSSDESVVEVSREGRLVAIGAGVARVDVINGDTEALLSDSDAVLLTGTIVVHVGTPGDADGDGTSDEFELRWGLNPNDADDAAQDTDRDGLSNMREYELGTSPTLADTDGDDLQDGAEVRRGSNPLLPDYSAPPGLNRDCTATALNRLVQVDDDGTFVLPNMPVPLGAFRVRVVCERNTGVDRGTSPFVTAQPNDATDVGGIDFTDEAPIPVSVELSSTRSVLNASNSTASLTLSGRNLDGRPVDITPLASGTEYRSSNPAIVAVSGDGVVTAISSGTVLITATNEGLMATVGVSVELTSDTDNDGIPDDFETANGPEPRRREPRPSAGRVSYVQ